MTRKEKKYHYIYKTTNLKNGKYYIGMHSTDNLEDGYMGSGKRLRRSLKKYGKENFRFEILEFLNDRTSLKEREKELVNEEIIQDSLCMNLMKGGEGGYVNEEHYKKTSKIGGEIHKLRMINDEEYRIKTLNILNNNNMKIWDNPKNVIKILKNIDWTGKKHSEETKKKMFEIVKLRTKDKNSQFGTCWITNGDENKKIKKEGIIPDGWRLGGKYKNIHRRNQTNEMK
jgi:group I intron endonuclease